MNQSPCPAIMNLGTAGLSVLRRRCGDFSILSLHGTVGFNDHPETKSAQQKEPDIEIEVEDDFSTNDIPVSFGEERCFEEDGNDKKDKAFCEIAVVDLSGARENRRKNDGDLARFCLSDTRRDVGSSSGL
ncbi:MAG: hypothetical protein ACE5GK_05285 [Nitrospiria bacterium]